MHGWLWIDPTHERITRIQGELFQDVTFGWGIFGRLYKGGRFEVVQAEVAPGIWRITLDVDFRGRLMVFSSLRIYRREDSSDFVATAPEMNAHNALIQLLSSNRMEAETHRSSVPAGHTQTRQSLREAPSSKTPD